MKIMGALMPFMFKSQTKKMMADFKAFAEATG
jgi:ribosome-associated toxin RatA of RatAB toxin-antitoxin module